MSARRPAPAFRSKEQHARDRRRRNTILATVGGGVLAVVLIAGGLFFLLRDGDDGAGGTVGDSGLSGRPTQVPSQSRGGTQDSRSPVLDGPASRFVPELGELPRNYSVLPPDTFSMSPLQFATVGGAFDTPEQGENLLTEWGYKDGYQAVYEPGGKLAEVVGGLYYVTVDSVLFDTDAGARRLYNQLETKYAARAGSLRVTNVKGLGNESSGWLFVPSENGVPGTIGTSDVVGIYHRFVFRRGNLVVTVQTYGGEPFMNIDRARDLAVVVDDRALGGRPAVTPTPRPTAAIGAR